MASPEINGQLPLDIAPFLGRSDLLTTTSRVLKHARMVTLTGPAGVGKTRLALRIARQAAASDVWLVDISAIADQANRTPESLWVHLALVLGIRHNGVAGLDTVLDHLRGRSVLLLLDNCDQLVGPTRQFLRRLLVAAPQVRILATSRQPLGVEGERRVPVPPLEPADAVAVFVENAVAAGADRALVQADPDIERLCQRLDGLPLAITLAAARIPALSVHDLLTLLDDDRFAVLHDVEVAVAVSYDLCSDDERRVWQCASLFAGSFDLAAITAVSGWAGLDTAVVLDTVTALVQKSILTADSTSGATRYGMLDTLRDYALRILDGHPDDDTLLRRLHRDYVYEAMHRAATCWLSPDELDVMAAVHEQMPDVLTAVNYCTGNGELAAARAILRDVVRSRAPFFWGFLGLIAQQLQEVIDASLKNAANSSTNDRSPADAVDIAATTAMASWIAVTVGRRDDADRLLTIAKELVDSSGMATIAPILFAHGGYQCLAAADTEGIGMLSAARDLSPGAEFAGDRQMATMIRAMGFAFTGEPEAAVHASTEYLRQARHAGGPWDTSWALWTCALAALRSGDHGQATSYLESCLQAQRTMDDRWGQTWSIELSAWLTAAQLDHADKPHTAARRSQWLLGAAQARQDQLGVGLNGLTSFAAQRTKAEEAISRHLDSVAMAAAFDRGTKQHQDALGVALGEPQPRSRRHRDHPSGLSTRELQIVELVASGLTSPEIAERLHLATATVNTHVKRILSKLGLNNRAALAAWTAENAINS